ncbi:SDR family oxidoreductase [Streptomyces sp. NPDC029004]|uniref:SDR family oxidoreductase n=1 Tax=Streptomyces sp. NPDC029004 TaxID=3154490 RepID=UPI0033F930AC
MAGLRKSGAHAADCRLSAVGAYGTGKAALLHLTQQLAGELAPGVRVNAVPLGPIRTEMARLSGRVPSGASPKVCRWGVSGLFDRTRPEIYQFAGA